MPAADSEPIRRETFASPLLVLIWGTYCQPLVGKQKGDLIVPPRSSLGTSAARHLDPSEAQLDLRDDSDRERHGVIPGSVQVPYPDLETNVKPGALLHELAVATD